jgi:hypothetical protein
LDLYLLYWLVTAQGGWEKVRAVRVYKGSGNRCPDPDPDSLLIPNLVQNQGFYDKKISWTIFFD